MLLPKVYQYYKSYRSRPPSMIKPLPTKASHALWILLATGLVAIISILPFFQPENIFLKTQSYPGTPGSILLKRLEKLRPTTATDEQLCEMFGESSYNKPMFAESLYARYGPDALVNNPISRPDEIDAQRLFLLYAAPSMLVPHLMHLLALGIATSGLLAGKEAARWRTVAILAGLGIAGLELYLIETYDLAATMRGSKVSTVRYIYWTVRSWRGIAIATVDAVLGWVIWLQATGRAFVTPAPPIEKVAEHGKVLEVLLQKIGVVGVVKNGTMRDAGLRKKVDDYWRREQEAMIDILQEPEVQQAQRNVMAKKDMGVVGRDIGQFVDGIMPMVAGNAAP